MLPIKQFLPERFRDVIDLEKVENLLRQNGVHEYRAADEVPTIWMGEETHNPNSLRRRVIELCSQNRFPTPEEPFFSLWYKLDDTDFKNAFLYLPEFARHLHFPSPSLESMIRISQELTQLFPTSLLAVYEGERWKIPVLRLYEGGKMKMESKKSGGNQEYHADWEERDHQRFRDSYSRNVDKFVGMLSGPKAKRTKRIK